ncbi:hypothetical protein, partial [Streptomyces sp. JV184]
PESQFLYAAYRQNTSGYLINDYYAKQRANKAAEYRAQAKLAEQRRKAEQQRKQNGILGSIKSGISNAWKTTGGNAVSAIGDHFSNHWRDWVGSAALVAGALGGIACVASMVCGVVGAAVIGAGSAAASYAAFNAGTKSWNTTSFVMSTATGGITGYLGGTSTVANKVVARMSIGRLERSLTRIEKTVRKMREFD